MKKVVSGDELTEKMQEAINLLCGTVKQTLGPKGNNVIIDHSTFNPFITNDGVTIAENIESEDPVVNTILELAKEASIKTNDNVGDGTTTTLVLLESIFNLGLEYIKKGINPLVLKHKLDTSCTEICKLIEKNAKSAKKSDIKHVACISANDKNIGEIVSNVFEKIKIRKAIYLKESELDETYITFNKGYSFDTILASPYFLNKNEINWQNPYCLIINEEINDIETINQYINLSLEENTPLCIIAPDYSDLIVNEIVSLYLEEKASVILLKTPLYGTKQQDFYQDIKTILKGSINKVLSIQINKEQTLVTFSESEEIKKYITKLKHNYLNSSEEEKEFIKLRIAYFTTGTADIYIGAPTKTERREKRMRFEDALWACEATKHGIVTGGGLTLLKISDNMLNNNIGNSILKEALTKPLEQILLNSGNNTNIINKIREKNHEVIYNVNTNEYENVIKTNIIDPKMVVINSLKNACSIASMLLTTSSLVVNEFTNEINKINDFNEL